MVSTIISNLALPASAVVTGPVLARALDPVGRGELATAVAPVVLVAFLLTFGLPEAIIYRVASRTFSAHQILPTAMLLGAATGVIGAGGLWLVAPLLLMRVPALIPLLQLLALTLPIVLALTGARGVAQARGDFRTVNIERWVTALVRLFAILAFALAGVLSVASAAWISTTAGLVGGIALLMSMRQIHPSDNSPPVKFGFASRSLFSYGSRVWLGSLSTLLILRIDQVLMVPLTTSEQLGLYAVAVAIAEVPTAAFSAVRDVLFSRSTAEGTLVALARACRVSVAIFIPSAILFWFVGPTLVSWAFGTDFAAASSMAQLLWIASAFSGVAGICGAGLLSLNRPGLYSIMQAGVAVFNIVLTLVLVPSWGGLGASAASLFSYIAFAAVGTFALVRLGTVSGSELWLVRPADVLGLVRRASCR